MASVPQAGITVMALRSLLFALRCRFCRVRLRFVSDILNRYPLTGIFPVIVLRYGIGEIKVSDEAVIDHDALSLVFAKALCLKHVNVVDQLLQQRRGQRLHLHKLFDGRDKVFSADLQLAELIHSVAEFCDLVFEFQPFDLIFVRQLHEPLVCYFTGKIIFVQFFIPFCQLLPTENAALDLRFKNLFLTKHIVVRFFC